MNARCALALARPPSSVMTTGTTAASNNGAEVECAHWLWPSRAVAGGVDVPHWVFGQKGGNK